MTTNVGRLAAILNGLQTRLEGDLAGNRAALTHPGARGAASEEDWLRVLKAHLPNRYQVDRGFVIDSQGGCSDQIDIIIYDRQYSPLLYNQADQRYVPAESVYGILEVKQDLTLDHVRYAGEKAASVRRLQRTSVPIPSADGTYPARQSLRIVAGILAYESSWSPPFGTPLSEALTGLPEQGRLDIGCALCHGAFEVRYDPVNVVAVDGGRSLVQFMMRLLKQLQALATAPAIDYDAYLTGLD